MKDNRSGVKYIAAGIAGILIFLVASMPLMEYELAQAARTYQSPWFYVGMMTVGYPILLTLLGILLNRLTVKVSAGVQKGVSCPALHFGAGIVAAVLVLLLLSSLLPGDSAVRNMGMDVLELAEEYPVIYILFLVGGWIWDLTGEK